MQHRGKPVIVKKYSNRRLYDTADSRYITLDELAQKIKKGTDVRVIDASTEEDLTQSTLTQLILESGRAARMLPVPLLAQIIRLGDDELAEFFNRYMAWAMDIYMQAKNSAQALSAFNPLATLPFTATSALARLFNQAPWSDGSGQGAPHAQQSSEPRAASGPGASDSPTERQDATSQAAANDGANGNASAEDVAALRREIDELKRAIRAKLG